MYGFAVKLVSGKCVARYAENIIDVPDVTDDGETLYVFHGPDEFPITADMCNAARAWRAYWRETYAAAGKLCPRSSQLKK